MYNLLNIIIAKRVAGVVAGSKNTRSVKNHVTMGLSLHVQLHVQQRQERRIAARILLCDESLPISREPCYDIPLSRLPLFHPCTRYDMPTLECALSGANQAMASS